MTSDQLAALIAGYADDKKAQSIVELDLRGVIDYTDYFVICSGGSDRQVKAIHDGIHAGCKAEYGILPRRVEGLALSAATRACYGVTPRRWSLSHTRPSMKFCRGSFAYRLGATSPANGIVTLTTANFSRKRDIRLRRSSDALR